MERGEIERLLTWPSDSHCERTLVVLTRDGMGELLRLALLGKRVEEAPVAEIDGSGAIVTLIAEGFGLDNAITSAKVDAMHGQRVALVGVSDE